MISGIMLIQAFLEYPSLLYVIISSRITTEVMVIIHVQMIPFKIILLVENIHPFKNMLQFCYTVIKI